MIPAHFDAALKTEDNKLLEIGFATVSQENGTVSFKNEFVPLLNLGTTAKIVRIIDEKETHCFTGKVYLSSRQLLQLVEVKDSILHELEKYMPSDITMNGHVTYSDCGLKLRRYDAKIYSISLNSVRFMSKKEFNTGDRLTLETKDPVELKDVIIEVTQPIAFGSGSTGNRCNIVYIPEQSLENLSNYMESANLIFPQD
ncbi:MAG: hypothetical protein VB100_00545 [Angelakisella sp.]|nr:hypothetical protein [Angelakisella sp.]